MRLPVIQKRVVFHVGDLSHHRRASASLEGPGLSVTTHPEDWRVIARLAGSTYQLRRKDGEAGVFADARKLSRTAQQALLREAVRRKLVSEAEGWQVSWLDTENEEHIEVTFATREEALDEVRYGQSESTMRAVRTYRPTSSLQRWWKKYFSEPMSFELTPEMAILRLLAEDPALDGAWWSDRASRSSFSAPRGVIFPHRIAKWSAAVVEDDWVGQ